MRFGFRRYNPSVGRFTAPDPLGDTGGDHDLYDYCVDDPVILAAPTGLLWEFAFRVGLNKVARKAVGHHSLARS